MKSLIALLAALAAAFVLSSCTSPAETSGDGHTDHAHGSESSAASPAMTGPAMTGPAMTQSAAPHNAADIAFATNMIPHHQQAVAMSELVPDRSSDPAVVDLAAAISAAQGPEIETMEGFLVQWNAPPAGDHQGHDATDMPDMPAMPGMVDEASMTKLQSLKGAEFDQLWLQSMIGHHEGAIAMAKTEIADGVNPDAKALAEQIVTTQTTEIDQMKKMLGQ